MVYILPKVLLSLSLCVKSALQKREKTGRIFEEDLPFFCFSFEENQTKKEEEKRRFLNFGAQLSSFKKSFFVLKAQLCSFSHARQSLQTRWRLWLLMCLWTVVSVVSFENKLLLPLKMGVIIENAFKREMMGNENNRDTHVTATDE
jgi:hypothetical protein